MPDSSVPVPCASPVAGSVAEPDYRFTLANERTFLAWQRTALGLLAAGLAALHFLPDAGDAALGYGLGGLLGVSATLTAAGGLRRWRRNDAAIRRGEPLPSPRLPAVLATILIGVAILTAVAAGLAVAM